jgi:hypothetical protein
MSRSWAAISSGRMRVPVAPGSADTATGIRSLKGISSASIVVARCCAEISVNPRICMLPRPVISMSPLPWVRAATHSEANASMPIRPDGTMRTSSPSPVSMGSERRGQAPRGRGAAALAALCTSLLIPLPPKLQAHRSSEDRFAWDAKTPCAARRQASRRSHARPVGSPG